MPTNGATQRLQDVNTRLRAAITSRDKAAIQACYRDTDFIDLDTADDSVFRKYDALISEANDILYS